MVQKIEFFSYLYNNGRCLIDNRLRSPGICIYNYIKGEYQTKLKNSINFYSELTKQGFKYTSGYFSKTLKKYVYVIDEE